MFNFRIKIFKPIILRYPGSFGLSKKTPSLYPYPTPDTGNWIAELSSIAQNRCINDVNSTGGIGIQQNEQNPFNSGNILFLDKHDFDNHTNRVRSSNIFASPIGQIERNLFPLGNEFSLRPSFIEIDKCSSIIKVWFKSFRKCKMVHR